LMPLIRSLAPVSTTSPDATATSLASTYEVLTSKTTIDFRSTDKPLAEWNGIPIMPQAVAGQHTVNGAYEFRVPVDYGLDMEAIETYYSDKLKSMGWNLADSRWQGMQFTKGKSVLLFAITPTPDAQNWVVSLVLVP